MDSEEESDFLSDGEDVLFFSEAPTDLAEISHNPTPDPLTREHSQNPLASSYTYPRPDQTLTDPPLQKSKSESALLLKSSSPPCTLTRHTSLPFDPDPIQPIPAPQPSKISTSTTSTPVPHHTAASHYLSNPPSPSPPTPICKLAGYLTYPGFGLKALPHALDHSVPLPHHDPSPSSSSVSAREPSDSDYNPDESHSTDPSLSCQLVTSPSSSDPSTSSPPGIHSDSSQPVSAPYPEPLPISSDTSPASQPISLADPPLSPTLHPPPFSGPANHIPPLFYPHKTSC